MAAALVPYGVGAADLTDLQTKIDAYVTVVSAPRTVVTVRKDAGGELEKLVHDTLEILNNWMDMLMPQFKAGDPKFFQEYFDARIIVDLGVKAVVVPVPPVPPVPPTP